MHNAQTTKKGFTIIELLVSIVIIGILATITVVSYSAIQQRSRDSRRDSDVTQLRLAIDKYHADKSGYPDVCAGDNIECPASDLTAVLQPYLKAVPHDPKHDADSATDYRYIRGALTTDSYGILVSYETKSACKIGQNVTASWWTIDVPAC